MLMDEITDTEKDKESHSAYLQPMYSNTPPQVMHGLLECVIPRGLHQERKTYRDAFIAHLDAFFCSFIPYHLATLALLCTH